MNEEKREEPAGEAWGIELFHRSVKQCCGIEKSMVRKARKVFNHVCLSIRTFFRPESQRLIQGLAGTKQSK